MSKILIATVAGAWLVPGLSACSSKSSCTLVAGESSIIVEVANLPAFARSGHSKLCIGTLCSEQALHADTTMLSLDDPALTAPTPVTVTLTVTGQDGSALSFDQSQTVTPVKHQPNGAACAPTYYAAALTVTTDLKLAEAPKSP